MTVATSENTVTYTGNGVTTAFSFPYLFYLDGDLSVTVDGVAQVIATDYTVSGAENPAGGTVTFLSAPASSASIVIQRLVDYVQETDLENFDGNPADVTEKQFDLCVMMSQQLADDVSRSLRLPAGDSATTELPSEADRASKFLAFDADGNAIASEGSADGLTVSAFGATLIDDASASAARSTLGLGTAAVYSAEEIGAFHRPLAGKIAPNDGLVIYRGSATQITITAYAVILKNSSNQPKVFDAISEVIDITVSGENGLDTGTEAISTWYHMWLIGKADGTESAVLSTSASAPTLPSGYTYYGYLGSVYNDASGNLISFRQQDNRVTVAVQTGVSDGTATTFTAIDLAQKVPSTATAVQFEYGVRASSGTATVAIVVAAAGSGTSPIYGYVQHKQVTSSTTTTYGNASLVFNTAQELVYYVSGANARGYVDVTGWWY